MAKRKKDQTESGIEQIEETLSRTELYIEENQKSLLVIALAIIVIVGGYFAYQNFYVASQEEKAQSEMFVAEHYFELDSFNLVLNGDGNELGVLDIIDEYGVTKAANLAHYYAGISYLRLGDYDNAIEYLQGFDSNNHTLSILAVCAIGDAYSQKKDTEQAVDYYEKAAGFPSDDFATPYCLMKTGQTYERLGKYDKALQAYEAIKNDYKRSTEARQIDKYITRAKLNM